MAAETRYTIHHGDAGWIGNENNKLVMSEGAVYISSPEVVKHFYQQGYNQEDYVTRLSREPLEQAYLCFYLRRGVAFKDSMDKAIR